MPHWTSPLNTLQYAGFGNCHCCIRYNIQSQKQPSLHTLYTIYSLRNKSSVFTIITSVYRTKTTRVPSLSFPQSVQHVSPTASPTRQSHSQSNMSVPQPVHSQSTVSPIVTHGQSHSQSNTSVPQPVQHVNPTDKPACQSHSQSDTSVPQPVHS